MLQYQGVEAPTINLVFLLAREIHWYIYSVITKHPVETERALALLCLYNDGKVP